MTAGTASSDVVCGCANGEGTADGTTCAACVATTTFSAGVTPLSGGTEACAAVTVCSGTQVTMTAGTANSDVVCGCPIGEGTADGSTCAACVATTTFSDAVTPLTGATSTCAAVTVCGSGKAIK